MKTLVLSMISIAATVAAMTACTSESDEIDNIAKDAKVEIQLNAGVTAVTKAAIESTFSEDFNALFFRPDDGTKGVDTWKSGTQLYAKVLGIDKTIHFYTDAARGTEAKQYYNTDTEKKSFLAGCAIGNAVTSDDLTDGSINITIDGTQDIMTTNGQEDKTKDTKFGDFAFDHQLSQLIFQVGAKENTTLADVTKAYGDITGITVLNQPKDFKLTLAATPTFEIASGDKSDSQFILKDSNDSAISDQALTATMQPFGGAMMIYPSSATKLSLLIFTKNYTSGIPVDVTLNFQAGSTKLEASKKYTIGLSFAPSEISSKATVGAWNDGGSSNGSIN